MIDALKNIYNALSDYTNPIVFSREGCLCIGSMSDDGILTQVGRAVDVANAGTVDVFLELYNRAMKVARKNCKDELPGCSYAYFTDTGFCLVFGQEAVELSIEQVMMGKPWTVQGNYVYDCCDKEICEFSGIAASSYIREAILLPHLTDTTQVQTPDQSQDRSKPTIFNTLEP